jgi:hypothetical protein
VRREEGTGACKTTRSGKFQECRQGILSANIPLVLAQIQIRLFREVVYSVIGRKIRTERIREKV